MLARIAQNGFIFLRIGKGGGFGTQLLRQAQRTQNRAALVFGQSVQLRRFDIHRMPDAAKFGRQARGGADKLFIAAAVAYAQQDGISRMPDALLALQVAPGAHLIVDAIGSTTQGQLAQGNQVTFTEEMFDGALGLAGNIDFAFMQALAQIISNQKKIGDDFRIHTAEPLPADLFPGTGLSRNRVRTGPKSTGSPARPARMISTPARRSSWRLGFSPTRPAQAAKRWTA